MGGYFHYSSSIYEETKTVYNVLRKEQRYSQNNLRVNEDKWGKAGGKFLDRKEKLKGQFYLLHKIGKGDIRKVKTMLLELGTQILDTLCKTFAASRENCVTPILK